MAGIYLSLLIKATGSSALHASYVSVQDLLLRSHLEGMLQCSGMTCVVLAGAAAPNRCELVRSEKSLLRGGVPGALHSGQLLCQCLTSKLLEMLHVF